MPSRNIHLTEHFADFVAEQVQSGLYNNASEVMRAGLTLLEQEAKEREVKLSWLRQEIRKGADDLRKGHYKTFKNIDALDVHLEKIAEKEIGK